MLLKVEIAATKIIPRNNLETLMIKYFFLIALKGKHRVGRRIDDLGYVLVVCRN